MPTPNPSPHPLPCVYHVISRGNNKAKIFHADEDYYIYLSLLRECRERHDFQLFHYNLMPNHVHLQIGVADPAQLAALMKSINQKYSWTYKGRYGFVGHVWQNRYRRFPITNDSYMLTCGIYIELNPVRAGIVARPEEHAWSSYRAYAYGEPNDLITYDPTYLGLGESPEERRQAYRELTEMWLTRPVVKKAAKKFFGRQAEGMIHPEDKTVRQFSKSV